jgi:hypothetical protein
MAAGMPELRTPVMILVDVSWEEPGGVHQKARGCMEDKSGGGVRLRLKTPIAAGSTVKIQWRFEQFAGIVKYCRREGREYAVGIQRAPSAPASNPAGLIGDSRQFLSATDARAAETKNKAAQIRDSRVSPSRSDSPAQGQEPGSREGVKEIHSEASVGAKRIEITALLQSVSLMDPAVRRPIRRGAVAGKLDRNNSVSQRATARDRPRTSRRREFEVSRQIELRTDEVSARKEPEKERKPMAHKWLGLAPWHNKQDDPGASEKENAKPDEIMNGGDAKKSASAKENRMPQSSQSMEKPAANSAREVPAFQVELLPMEDIYRTAGIVSPRKGYSVPKVVEMLNSEHIRGLSKETKRAALLMALDAAGVTIEQVQRDGKARQNALDAYEAEQKKQAEAEWARKAEEITHIQAELESIKAHYTARISRNMEALARDKARFNSWVTTKEQESQSMAEAVELCLKSPGSEPVASREREMSAAAGNSAAAAVGAAKAM